MGLLGGGEAAEVALDVENDEGAGLSTGLPQPVTSASYNANNQLTQWNGTTLTYDAEGNLTSDGTNTYTWDAGNQLVSIGGGTTANFMYDAFGRRAQRTVGGASRSFLYDGLNMVQEQLGGGQSANLLTGGLDEYFLRTDPGWNQYFLTDALGSTLGLADSSGSVLTQYTYEAFGLTSVTGAAAPQLFQYTARENDDTGLFYYRARYYHPILQRFISEDPIGFAAGDFNLYGYVGQDPINLVDPLGLFGIHDVSDFIAGAGDSLTFGGTAMIRRLMNDGYDPANTCSGWYTAGEYAETAVEIVLTGGSAALKHAAAKQSRRAVYGAASRLTKPLRQAGKNVHHINPLFGHPGGFPALFPTGGLPASIHSSRLNLAVVDEAAHAGIHRQLRLLEDIGAGVVNPATTSGRLLRNALIGRGCGCE